MNAHPKPLGASRILLKLLILSLLFLIDSCTDKNSTGQSDDFTITPNKYILVEEGGDIVLINAFQKTHFKLTSDGHDIEDYNAQFSADGENIIWQRVTGNYALKSSYEVWIMNINGENKNNIAYGQISPINTCSPNDEIILVDTMNILRKYNISGQFIDYLAADGGYKYIPQWSPDGTKVGYITKGDFWGEPTYEENPNLVVFDSDGSGRQDIITENETEVFFDWIDNDSLAIVKSLGDFHKIFIRDIINGQRIEMPENIDAPFPGIFKIYLDISYDSSMIFYTDQDDKQLYSISIEGGGHHKLSEGRNASYAAQPRLSSDGTKISYCTGTEIIVSNLNGQNKDTVYHRQDYLSITHLGDFY